MSPEGNFTASLGSMFECSITRKVKKLFLLFIWNFLCSILCSLPHLMLVLWYTLLGSTWPCKIDREIKLVNDLMQLKLEAIMNLFIIIYIFNLTERVRKPWQCIGLCCLNFPTTVSCMNIITQRLLCLYPWKDKIR